MTSTALAQHFGARQCLSGCLHGSADDAAMRVPPVRELASDPAQEAREARRRQLGLLTGVTDAHVHLFPDQFYAALHRWFDAHAWEIRFRGGAEQVVEKLRESGVSRMVALLFSHKPGTARYLNAYLAALQRSHPAVIGVAAVLPGEPDDLAIVREAIEVHGLRGVKIHCHVAKLAIDDPRVLRVLGACANLGVPAVVHAGKEPSSAAYGVDTRALCSAQQTRRVLQLFPDLRLVVPHLGADEYGDYLAMTREFAGLYLDTAMACADYFDAGPDWAALERHSDRVLYGTDFPIVPYDADRELRVLARRIGSDAALAAILRGNADRLWGGQ